MIGWALDTISQELMWMIVVVAVIALRPLPTTGTFCGLPTALSTIAMVALRISSPVGVKVTVMVQLALVCMLAPHVFVCVKSPGLAPATAIDVMLNGVGATLVSVTTRGSPDLR